MSLRIGMVAVYCEHGNEPSNSTTDGIS